MVERPADPIERARRQWVAHGLAAPDRVIAMASLLRAGQILEARIADALKPLGLNLMRYDTLSNLYLSEAGRRTGEVAWGLNIHPATLTAVIDWLEKRGLVQRHPDATDRRSVLVTITPEGREIWTKAYEAVVLAADCGLEGISDDDALHLTTILTGLRAAHGDIRPSPSDG